MLTGKADTLSSRFHLSYNMLLNCIRVETADVEMLISKSFYTFQQLRALPDLQAQLAEVQRQMKAPENKVPHEALVTELHSATLAEIKLRDELRTIVNEPIRGGRAIRGCGTSAEKERTGTTHMSDMPSICGRRKMTNFFIHRSARKGSVNGEKSRPRRPNPQLGR